MFKVLYTIVSVLLFALFIVSTARLGLTGAKEAGADTTKMTGWVDGIVYTINGFGNREYLSSNTTCGSYIGMMKVSGSTVNKCSGSIPYYNFIQDSDSDSYKLDLPDGYECNSWVAVNAEDPEEIIAYGECSGSGHDTAEFENPLDLNISLWWKVDKL